MGREQRSAGNGHRSAWVGFTVAFVLGAATYAAWLAWDTEYYYDAAVGAYQGPYRPAQVVGCALTFALVTAILAMRWKPVSVAVGASLGFWLLWTVQASIYDESGLFVIGSVLLLIGLAAGSAAASALGFALRTWRDRVTLSRGPS